MTNYAIDTIFNTGVFDNFTTKEFRDLAIQARNVRKDYLISTFGENGDPAEFVVAQESLPEEEANLLTMLETLAEKYGEFYDRNSEASYLAYKLIPVMEEIAPCLCFAV